MIKNWLSLFIYHIKNNKLFTALNILGLSIGIAGLIFALLYWNDEKSYNAWNPGKDNVFMSISQVSTDSYWASSVAGFDLYLKQFPEVEAHCYLNNWYYEEIINYKNKKEFFKILDAQPSFFKMFPFQFVKGNPNTAIADKGYIALSEQAAKTLFGNEEPMGKTVTYSGHKLVVNGIYHIPGKSSLAPQAVTYLLADNLKEEYEHWGNFNFGLLVKLKDPNDKAKVIKKLDKILFEKRVVTWAKEEGLTPAEWLKKHGSETTKIIFEPLSDARLHSMVDAYAEGKGNYQFLMIMMGLSILILILSIVNYINLATASAIKRAKEIGVRKILGASKSNIVYQFIFETILISAFALLLAMVIVELSLPYYNEFLNKDLVIQSTLFYKQLILILILVVATAGIFPALYVSNFETLKVLKGNFGRSKSGIWLRNALLVVQFAIASFFIVGSYIVYEQVKYLNERELGFKGEQILQINYRNNLSWRDTNAIERLYQRYLTVKHELSKIKGVQTVSTGAFRLGTGANSSSSFDYNSVTIQGQNMGVDFGMLEMLKIKMKEGRYLESKYPLDTVSTMLINETAQREMKEKNPIGKYITWNDKKLQVVGVVKDFNVWGPQVEIPPMAFFHFKTIGWMIYNVNQIYVKTDGKNTEQTIADIEKFWVKKVDPEYPFTYSFVDKNYAQTYEEFIKQKRLFSLLNIVVILIALFGLFALATYSIERRMKEIAIRKILGAETKTLLGELSKQYLVFGIIGFVIALFPTYYLLSLWLDNFKFRIDMPIIPYIVGFIVLLLLTLIIVLSKAYQATRVDVLKYLKYE